MQLGYKQPVMMMIMITFVMMPAVSEALFYTGVTTLLRDPWGGLSSVPLITILFRFAFANLHGYL